MDVLGQSQFCLESTQTGKQGIEGGKENEMGKELWLKCAESKGIWDLSLTISE